MPFVYDLTVKKQLKTASAAGPVAFRISGPFLTIGEICLLTGLVIFAVTIALIASLTTGNSGGGTAVCTDAFGASLVFTAISWVRLRLTKADHWVGFLLLGTIITSVMALISICVAVFA